MAQPKRSCLVIDDSFDSALQSSVMDHLFRVMSGKLSISVILMTQNIFSKGKFGRDIRNSCNFVALFRNCADTRINSNFSRMVGLSHAFEAARIDLDGQMFPVMFLDLSQKGQLSKYRLYTNLFGSFQTVFSTDGMKGYIINENDFESYFKVILGDGNNFEAEENENKTPKIKTETNAEKATSSEERETENVPEISKNDIEPKNVKKSRKYTPNFRKRRNQGSLQRWKNRSEYNISKYKKYSKLFGKNK